MIIYNYNSNNSNINVLNDHVNNSDYDYYLQKIQNKPDAKLKVKISGDGARMSMLTNFVIMSYSMVENDVMSSKGNTTCSKRQIVVP